MTTTRRKPLPLSAAVLMVLAILVSACGVQPTGAIYGALAPTEELEGPVLFFLNGHTLTRVTRPPSDPFQDNLTLLSGGPTNVERAEGLSSEIPPAAAPITMSGDNTKLNVRTSSSVAELSLNAQDQIACTAAPPWSSPDILVYIIGTDNKPTKARACPYRS